MADVYDLQTMVFADIFSLIMRLSSEKLLEARNREEVRVKDQQKFLME